MQQALNIYLFFPAKVIKSREIRVCIYPATSFCAPNNLLDFGASFSCQLRVSESRQNTAQRWFILIIIFLILEKQFQQAPYLEQIAELAGG